MDKELHKGRSITEIQAAREVLDSLNQVIKEGPWDANLFLRGVKGKLLTFKDKLEAELKVELSKNLIVSEGKTDSTFQEVFIVLYQSQGADLHRWWQVVVSLVDYYISRPVYKKEEDAQSVMQTNEYSPNHAYIVVKVRPEDIVSTVEGGGVRLDRSGRDLLSLREASLQIKNMVRFVHTTGNYKLKGNTLVREE